MTTTNCTAVNRKYRKCQTVTLHRFVQLNDRFETQVFTFIVPSHISKGFLKEAVSRDFIYGHQKWIVQLTRSDRHVGTFLILKNSPPGMSVKVDYSFSIPNRQHFTRNEIFAEKNVTFNTTHCKYGRDTFVGAQDLSDRNFLFDDSCFLLELELRNPLTEFREVIQLPREPRDLNNLEKLESSYFTFGDCDWNVVVSLIAENSENKVGQQQRQQPIVFLQRHSHFEHWCRVRFRAIFICNDDKIDTGIVEQLLDIKGFSKGRELDGLVFRHLNSRHPLRVELQIFEMCHVAFIDLLPTSRNKNCARCYDMEKQEWIVESDILGRVVKLRLYYADISNVPRDFNRLVCWNAQLMPFDQSKPPVCATNAPFCSYYSQKESDEGFEMAFDLPVEEICDNNAGYTDPNNNFLTTQIEWLHSHLLYHDFYHYYDDITRIQKHQMGREIIALQAENYALEKEVYSYQQEVYEKLYREKQQTSAATSNVNHTSMPLLSSALGAAVGALQIRASNVVAAAITTSKSSINSFGLSTIKGDSSLDTVSNFANSKNFDTNSGRHDRLKKMRDDKPEEQFESNGTNGSNISAYDDDYDFVANSKFTNHDTLEKD